MAVARDVLAAPAIGAESMAMLWHVREHGGTMTIAAERLATQSPGRMESHCLHRALAHPQCTLRHLDPDDLNHTMCDALPEEEKRLLARMDDEESFHLHVQFVRAHGAPQGEFTMLSSGGAMSCPKQHD
jgi:hypothetical protein